MPWRERNAPQNTRAEAPATVIGIPIRFHGGGNKRGSGSHIVSSAPERIVPRKTKAIIVEASTTVRVAEGPGSWAAIIHSQGGDVEKSCARDPTARQLSHHPCDYERDSEHDEPDTEGSESDPLAPIPDAEMVRIDEERRPDRPN